MATEYNARILRVDLTKGKTNAEDLGGEVTKKYVGGGGLAAKLLWDETTADTEPLSPENLLIFMVGPLTGIVRSSSRYTVAGISPLTGIYGEAHSGGDWGDELRHAGFDGIVIRGIADKPVYIWLNNGEVEIRDASHLWGKDTYEVEDLLRKETDDKASMVTIGPAGEKLVRIACIMNDGKKGRAAARCGLGALMGSKKLKAIMVRGNLPLRTFDEEKLKETKERIYASSPIVKHEDRVAHEVERLKSFMKVGRVPVQNWRGGDFAPGYKLAEEIYDTEPLFCRHCPYSDMESKQNPDGTRHMVWEHWAPLGTQCLIGNSEALHESYELCNRYGLDTISTGGVISFAMECYEKGLVTENQMDGIKLNWGNHQAMVEMVKKIGEREGFGELLGNGVRRAAEIIGGIASEYAIHVKGLEFPAHDPRAANSYALQFATASIGATHQEAIGAVAVEASFLDHLEEAAPPRMTRELGYSARVDRFESKGKGELVAKAQDTTCMLNSMVVCNFLPIYRNFVYSDFVELLNSVTGWNWDLPEFMRTGERISNLKRMINVRRGISRKDDTLPARILTHKRGEGGAAENLPHLGIMLNEYYSYRKWTEEGIPTKEKLTELGLNECLKMAGL